METHTLIAHPDCPPPPEVQIAAGWSMPQSARLVLEFRVTDPRFAIAWPAPAQGRTDNLWRHSCFEAFVASADGEAYAEFNLAPSGGWAAYAFDRYRSGMRELALAAPPQIAHAASDQWHATLDLAGLEEVIGPAPWRLAVTAVIEAKDGGMSYWSLCHPAGRPDFHHADCFAAALG